MRSSHNCHARLVCFGEFGSRICAALGRSKGVRFDPQPGKPDPFWESKSTQFAAPRQMQTGIVFHHISFITMTTACAESRRWAVIAPANLSSARGGLLAVSSERTCACFNFLHGIENRAPLALPILKGMRRAAWIGCKSIEISCDWHTLERYRRVNDDCEMCDVRRLYSGLLSVIWIPFVKRPS